jgi:hypothetical protein
VTADLPGNDPEVPEADVLSQQEPVVTTEAGEPDRRDPQPGAAGDDARAPAAAGEGGRLELPLEADVADAVEQRRTVSTAEDDDLH